VHVSNGTAGEDERLQVCVGFLWIAQFGGSVRLDQNEILLVNRQQSRRSQGTKQNAVLGAEQQCLNATHAEFRGGSAGIQCAGCTGQDGFAGHGAVAAGRRR
jgi:hypothetical protein